MVIIYSYVSHYQRVNGVTSCDITGISGHERRKAKAFESPEPDGFVWQESAYIAYIHGWITNVSTISWSYIIHIYIYIDHWELYHITTWLQVYTSEHECDVLFFFLRVIVISHTSLSDTPKYHHTLWLDCHITIWKHLPYSMEKSTIQMPIFHSELSVITRG